MAAKENLSSYPWYVSDWRGSQMRIALSTAGRGMYRELLDYCWETGYLPLDERSLIAISGGSKTEFKREWDVMKVAFFEQDGVLKHHKVEEKRDKLVHFRETRRSNASGKRNAGASDNAIAKASALPSGDAIGGPSLLPPPSYPSDNTSSPACADGVMKSLSSRYKSKLWKSEEQQEWFHAWWGCVWLKVGRGEAEKAFSRIVTERAIFDAVMKATVEQGPIMQQRERQFIKHPSSWLNGKHWMDEQPSMFGGKVVEETTLFVPKPRPAEDDGPDDEPWDLDSMFRAGAPQ